MKSKKSEQTTSSELRKRAEKKARSQKLPLKELSDKETKQIIHELQVHQIELEMQNDELLKSQAELEESRAKYSDLYDFAPVGYLTLDKNGLVLEANLTAAKELGMEKSLLVRKPFRTYVVRGDRDLFDRCLQQVFQGNDRESCEIRLKRKDGREFYAALESISANDSHGNPLCRTSVINITESKKFENVLTFLSQCGAMPGENFFRLLAKYLAENLGMEYVCIDRLEGECLTAQTLAVYFDGRFEDNLSYTLHDTPCGEVAGKSVCCFPSGVRQLFPRDTALRDMMAESYVGVTLWGRSGKPIGLIAVIGRQPLKNPKLAESILRLVAVRAADELERTQAEEALRHSEEYFRLLTENALDIITILEPDDTIRYETPSVEQVLGYPREDLVGRHYSELFHPDDLHDATIIFGRLMKKPGSALSFQARRRHQDGSWRIVEIMASNLIDNPSIKGIVVNSRDITERKKAEEELLRSNEDLKQFASAASHDLQEPLRGIESFIRLLEKRYKGKLDEKADEYIDYVVNDVSRMQLLIRDLLEYSRVSVHEKVFSPVNCSVALEQALLGLRSAVEESGAEVTYDLLPNVMGDDSQLTGLFQNLIGNAIKFRSQAPLRVHISARREGTEWLFSVRDNGIGINPKQAGRIFVIFQRLHSRQEYPGTGVGLAICKKIVERHGGRIWAESEPGQGTTFHFTLPDQQGNLLNEKKN